jgi:formylglycine-generating enzyme required for sulfatase activity
MLRPHGDSWSIQDRNSGLYLAVMKSSREQGAAICVESEGNASSQWIIEPTDPTFWKILNRNSGFALAIPQGQRNRGAVACQWPSWSGSDQQWEFKVEAPGSGAPLIKAPFDAPQAKQYQQRWAQQLGVPLQTTNSIGMKLVLIPPGEFEMGSPTQLIDEELKRPNVEWWYKVRLPREGPRHHVRITQPFYLGVYDVTQDEYERIMGTNPSEFSATGKSKDKVAGQDTNRFPVENVSWDDSADFCRRLSELPAEKAAGRRYQLPTEAQWEYACRAGSTGRFSFSATNGPTSKEHDEHAMEDYGWFGSNSGGMTHPVGLKQANAWGLYDMHGNVWQWCRDGYDNGYYGTSPVDDPSGASNAASHVNRGGSWPYPSRFCRSAFRDGGGPGDRTRGLRVSSVTVDIIGAAGQKRRTAAEDARRMATRPTVGVPEIPDIGLPTPAEARSGSRAPNKPTVVPPLVVDLQDPLAHCSVEMDDLPKGALLLEITKLEGSGAFDKDFTVDKPKPLRPGSPGILALTMKGYSNKVTFPITFAMKAEGKGFDITLKVGPKIVATCKDPPRDIEAAKSELRKNRDQAHDKMERAKGKEKLALTHIFEVCDRALASLQFFSEVNKVKVHFRVCVDTGDQHPTVIATTEGP